MVVAVVVVVGRGGGVGGEMARRILPQQEKRQTGGKKRAADTTHITCSLKSARIMKSAGNSSFYLTLAQTIMTLANQTGRGAGRG